MLNLCLSLIMSYFIFLLWSYRWLDLTACIQFWQKCDYKCIFSSSWLLHSNFFKYIVTNKSVKNMKYTQSLFYKSWLYRQVWTGYSYVCLCRFNIISWLEFRMFTLIWSEPDACWITVVNYSTIGPSPEACESSRSVLSADRKIKINTHLVLRQQQNPTITIQTKQKVHRCLHMKSSSHQWNIDQWNQSPR